MSTPVFYNKDGSLTRYSFACGYMEREETEEKWTEMYMEHQHFHVRQGKINSAWDTWETFDNNELTKARKLYRKLNK